MTLKTLRTIHEFQKLVNILVTRETKVKLRKNHKQLKRSLRSNFSDHSRTT